MATTMNGEAAFWEAVKGENYEDMVTACGGNPEEQITAFVASDIAIATHGRFSEDEDDDRRWTFADAQRIFANPSDYDEACLAMGRWADYVEDTAASIVDDARDTENNNEGSN
jgi:hypothetical protein